MIKPEDIKIKYYSTDKRIARIGFQIVVEISPNLNIESLDVKIVEKFNEKIYGDVVETIKKIQALTKKGEPSEYTNKKIDNLIKELEWK